ncbi:unknown [Clostridium sp. CAG:715]|nr:unknown [Clostridium sp. CAG:715]
MACKYYGADGTQLKPEYFKKVEGNISISSEGTSYTLTKNGKKSKPLKAKSPSLGQLDQNIAKLNNQEKKLNKIKKEQGFIGKGWDWFKNKTGIGDSSNKAQMQINAERDMLKQLRQPNAKIDQKQFEKITGQKYTKANLEKFKKGEFSHASQKVAGYQEGQEMAVDVVADVAAGATSFTIYTLSIAAAPFTGGGSIALGVALAAGTGALVKTGVKYADAVSGGRKYTLNDVKKDASTGAVSGLLAPITAGAGGAIGKTVATKLGLQTIKTVGKEIGEDVVENSFKQTLKTSLMSPGAFKYVGEGTGKKILAYSSEVVTDGALNGGIDNGFRTAVNGGSLLDVAKASGEGALFAPLVGLGMKGTGLVLSRGIGKKFVTHGKEVIENKRILLKQKMAQGNKVLQNSNTSIPKGALRAPSSKFAETDEAFINIVRNNKQAILELNKKSGDDFIKGAFALCKKAMGLEDAPIKLKIIGSGSNYSSVGDNMGKSAGIAINRNWQNGNKAELFAAICHELNHQFQYKEMYINSTLNDKHLNMSKNLTDWIDKHIEFLDGHENYYDKAEIYSDNFINHYIEPDVNFDAYRQQPVEAESMRRGELVRDAYNQVIQDNHTNIKLDPLERQATQQIINNIKRKYPNATIEALQEVANDAIATMRQPEFSNYTVDKFVSYFLSMY